jgi:nucleolar protein 14
MERKKRRRMTKKMNSRKPTLYTNFTCLWPQCALQAHEAGPENSSHTIVVANADLSCSKGLLNELEIRNPVFSIPQGSVGATMVEDPDELPFCPESHEQLLELTQTVPIASLPALVQRIRAQYRPQLDNGNKSKLGNFAVVLVQHLAYLSSLPQLPPFSVLETLIRHIHSLAKSHAVQLANEFRSHLLGTKPLDPQLGDLVILTAISTIFPTSDHWHQVASPAMLVMGKYLGQKIPTQLTDYTKGCYMSILALQFQKMSKRSVPEVHNFALNALASLAPVKAKEKLGWFPLHEPPPGMRILNAQGVIVKKLTCFDCVEAATGDNGVKVAVVDTAVKIIEISASLWSGKPSFFETFQPACNVLAHLQSKACRAALPKALNESIAKTKLKIDAMLQLAHMERRQLELHHHRPQAVS